jgi:hypothetical protein
MINAVEEFFFSFMIIVVNSAWDSELVSTMVKYVDVWWSI